MVKNKKIICPLCCNGEMQKKNEWKIKIPKTKVVIAGVTFKGRYICKKCKSMLIKW